MLYQLSYRLMSDLEPDAPDYSRWPGCGQIPTLAPRLAFFGETGRQDRSILSTTFWPRIISTDPDLVLVTGPVPLLLA